MNEQRMQFAIGIVTIIAGFALAAIVLWFGEFQNVFALQSTYYVLFDYAPGVEEKVPVRRAGMRIGEVRAVDFEESTSKVVVTMSLEAGKQMRIGDIPTLKQNFPLGDTYVDIVTPPELQGRIDRPVIAPGTTMDGRSPPDTSKILESTADLVPNANRALEDFQLVADEWTKVGERTNRILDGNEQKISAILQETRESMERLAVTLESINNTLTPKSQENMRVTLENIRKTSEDMGPLIESAKTSIDEVTKTTKRIDEVAQNLERATRPMANRSETTMRNLESASESLNIVLADLKTFSHQLNSQDGSIQRLMNDPSFYQHLDDAAFKLSKILGEVDRAMPDVRTFADKIARHPGEIGVQGVFTKDTGLKTVRPGMFEKRKKDE